MDLRTVPLRGPVGRGREREAPSERKYDRRGGVAFFLRFFADRTVATCLWKETGIGDVIGTS